jgi:predicted nucleotidyltransferase
MDKGEALNIAHQYIYLLSSKYIIVQAFIFGSFAKGTFNEDSDIDIAVVFSDYEDSSEIKLNLMRLRRKIDSRIEPHPFRESDFTLSNPMVNEILKYGQEIKTGRGGWKN